MGLGSESVPLSRVSITVGVPKLHSRGRSGETPVRVLEREEGGVGWINQFLSERNDG